jgi:hypothetical protein
MATERRQVAVDLHLGQALQAAVGCVAGIVRLQSVDS